MPRVKGLGVVAGGVRNAENAECTDCVTIASIAECWTGLKQVSCWKLGIVGISGSGSDWTPTSPRSRTRRLCPTGHCLPTRTQGLMAHSLA